MQFPNQNKKKSRHIDFTKKNKEAKDNERQTNYRNRVKGTEIWPAGAVSKKKGSVKPVERRIWRIKIDGKNSKKGE